jgi:hypothetical protein
LHEIDRAWIALGVLQAKIVASYGGLTKKEVAQTAMEELGDEAEKLYGLSFTALIKLANTSLENLVRIGLVRKTGNRFYALLPETCLDPSTLSVLLKKSLQHD